MKAGYYKVNEYLERLHEEAEVKSKLPAEGLILPEENKKSFAWLKKEYQKGKTEVKVEMKMGNQKFEPGYDLQTNLKSVKDFKPEMSGNVKTSDNKDSRKEDGQKEGKTPEGKAIEKKSVSVKSADAEVKDEKDGEKKVNKFQKKNEGYEVAHVGQNLAPDAKTVLSFINMSRKQPGLSDLYYCKKIRVNESGLEPILEQLGVVNFNTYQDFISEWAGDFPFNSFFIANILEESGVSFLVDANGSNNAKYIAELI